MTLWSASDHGINRADTDGPILDMVENVQEAVGSATPSMKGLQLAPAISGSAPSDWDLWLAAASTSMEMPIQNQYNDDTNQVLLDNWENFVQGFQGQDEVVISGPNGQAPEYSSLWP